MRIKLLAFFMCLFSVINLALAQKTVNGCYRTNFADLGMFGTNIRLNEDSTFYYKFAGDMMIRDGIGTYSLNHDTIYLLFNKNIKLSPIELLSSHTIQTGDIKLLFKQGKLFFFNINTGKLVTKGNGYSKRKKYLLWGSHYRTMRFYLKRFPCETWVNYESEYKQLQKLIKK